MLLISKTHMKKYRIPAAIVLISLIFFIPFLGKVHLFDWDEINFAEAAREMIETGDYLRVRIDYEPFHEKPPLFIWAQVLSMKAFGVNEFSARLPNAILGAVTLLTIFLIGKKVHSEKFGLVWALAYFGSFLPHFYFRSGIIDPYFNYFMFTSIYFLYRYHAGESRQFKYIIFASILDALAVLTKGPVGLLLVFLTWLVYYLFSKRKQKFPFAAMAVFIMIAALPATIWYMLVLSGGEGSLVMEFIYYQIRLLTTGDAGHSGPIFYHFIILLIGVFPASAFIYQAFREKNASQQSKHIDFKDINVILLLVVLIIFTIVKTKIVHYSSLAYFPMTYLAAWSLVSISDGRQKLKGYTKALYIGIGSIFALALIAFPIVMYNIESFLPSVTDKFTHAILSADVVWSGFETLIGVFFLISLIISFRFLLRAEILKGAVTIFAATAISIFLFLPVVAPKIEQYTQRAAIEFYKSKSGEDAYIYALGFKSYAQHFYSRKEIDQSAYSKNMNMGEFRDWLLEGEIDRAAYFVTFNKRLHRYEQYNLTQLYEKNGFVFLKREPNKFQEK